MLQAGISATKVSINKKTKRIDSVTTRDTTMEQAQEMVRKAMLDLRKFDRSKIYSTILIQGDKRSYSEPFYGLVKESIISELNKLQDVRINFVSKLPRVIIKGTPTSLSIAKSNENDIEKIALKSDANTILLWNLFEYNGEMNFIARIINTQSKAIMWHYKVNKEFIKNDKLILAELAKYKIDQNYYIATGLTTYFAFTPYTRKGVSSADTLTANWTLGSDLLYSTQSNVSPKLRLGAGINYLGSSSPSLPFSLVNIYVDVRYQLNEFIEPIYDTTTGDIVQRRNKQSLMLGFTFGRAQSFADEQNAGGTYSTYLNLGISDAFEINLGVRGYLSGDLTYKADTKYSDTVVDLGFFNMFFNVKYKFNYTEEK